MKTRGRSHRLPSWYAVAAWLLSGCAEPGRDDACAPLIPGITIVATAAAPDADAMAGRLVELWQVGGTNEGQEFVQPAAVAASATGTIAIVDHGLAEVAVVDRNGNWLGRWGREGPGPGELAMPVAAAWAGERLAVFDLEQSKVVFYQDAEVAAADVRVPGSFIAPVVMSGEVAFVGVLPDGSVLLQYPVPRSPRGPADETVLSVLKQSPGEPAPDTIASARVSIPGSGPYAGLVAPGSPVPRVAAGPNGWLAVAATDGSYRIAISDSTSHAVHQVCRRVEPLPLTEAEQGMDLPEDAQEFAHASRPAVLGVIGRLVIGPRGELWVDARRPAPFTSETLYGAFGSTLDAFNEDGHYLGSIRIPEGVSIQAIAGDRAWGIRFGSHDEAWIVGFAVEWTTIE